MNLRKHWSFARAKWDNGGWDRFFMIATPLGCIIGVVLGEMLSS